MAEPHRTVLLARPGIARERLRAALEQAGVDVVLEADPLQAGIDEIQASAARNLVIAVDAEVEDALARFDPLLVDVRYRILFEEAGLVAAREGWEAARWSRHLAAKLLGHGDVLPEGHEGDDAVSPGDQATALNFELALDEVVDTIESADMPATAGIDWTRFQDFEAIDELPAAHLPLATSSDFRAALAPLDADGLPHDRAYAQLETEMAGFDAFAPADRWQDFERARPEAGEPESDTETRPATPVAPPTAPGWSLIDAPLPSSPADSQAVAAADGMGGLGQRIASLSLVDADTPAPAADVASAAVQQPAIETAGEGAVLLIGGIGGPDPLRRILQLLGTGFSAPVLVQQWLDGGQYDRLVRQMARASTMPVELAENGQALCAGRVYIVPNAVTVRRDADGALRFADADTRAFADMVSALPVAGSGVVVLSGASQDVLAPVQRFQQAGGRVFAQSAEGCYDHAVPALLIQRGAEPDLPDGLAAQLAARWQQQVPA